jgi:hypothetical protein
MIEMKTFIYILITNFVFAETDEKVVKANVCVNVALIPPAGGRPSLKTYRQGAFEALCNEQIQGRESVSHDGDSICPSRIDLESITTVMVCDGKRVADAF